MIFARMSIFSTSQTLQSLKKLAVVVDGDCLLCGRVGEGEICASCEADLEGVDDPPPGQAVSYDAVTSVFAYRFPLERLIHRFKYAGDLAVGHWLASRLAHRVRRESPPDLIVVPPSTRMRLRERGFNPAAEVAKVVAHACNVQFESACVQRALASTRPRPASNGASVWRTCARRFAARGQSRGWTSRSSTT
jgi:Predicted amidophosphoribosyltransferases